MTLRALIVDDEPLARDRIRALLAREPDVEVVAECATGAEAIDAILSHEPALVFLDVQMPEVDGFGVVEGIGPARMPVTIFVTAFDDFALRAFEAHALDYLLKPFTEERFRSALERARRQVEGRDARAAREALQTVLADLAGRPDRPRRFPVRAGARIGFVDVESIDWIQADGNYVRLHTANGSHLLRESLSALEAQLDPREFLRIHRSTMVRLRAVQQLESLFKGEYLVILTDGTRLTSSRPYRAALERALDLL
jgi:two-component system, LytTR family, response regulator